MNNTVVSIDGKSVILQNLPQGRLQIHNNHLAIEFESFMSSAKRPVDGKAVAWNMFVLHDPSVAGLFGECYRSELSHRLDHRG